MSLCDVQVQSLQQADHPSAESNFIFKDFAVSNVNSESEQSRGGREPKRNTVLPEKYGTMAL